MNKLYVLIAAITTLFAANISNADVRQPVGFYVMQEVGAQNVSDTKLSSNKHAGIVIRESWAKLNPARGQYNWRFLDGQIKRCQKYNKQFILSVYTGSNAPKWITGTKFGPSNKLAPVPWSPDMLSSYEAMIKAVGDRYNSNPLLVGVEIGGPTCPDMSIEMHYTHSVDRIKGYSEAVMLSSWKRCGDAVAKAFPNVAVISDGGPAPGGPRKAVITVAFWDYMLKTYPAQFNASHCALAAKTAKVEKTWIGHTIVVDHKKKGGRVGFEAVGPSLGGVNGQNGPVSRFGGTFATSMEVGRRAGMSWYKYYQGDERVLPKF